MIQHVSFIFRNAMRSRRRSLLTVASIAFSFCLLGMLMSMYQSLFYGEDASPAAARRLVVQHRVSMAQQMPMAYRQKIGQVPGVAAVTAWQWFGGKYEHAGTANEFFARLAVDADSIFDVRPDLTIAPEQLLAFKRERAACVASRKLAARFGWKLGERITITGDIFPMTAELKLGGTFDGPEDEEVLYFHYDYLSQSLSWFGTSVGAYLVLVDTPQHVPQVAKAIDTLFDNSPAPTRSESERAFALSFAAFLGNLKLFLAAIGAAVTFTILLVSANTVAMTVRERVRETAILRTLGYSRGQILGLVLGEAVLLAGVGGLLGALMAAWASSALHSGSAGFPFPRMAPWVGAVVVAVALVAGLISAAAPAWFASRRNVVESLRYSG